MILNHAVIQYYGNEKELFYAEMTIKTEHL